MVHFTWNTFIGIEIFRFARQLIRFVAFGWMVGRCSRSWTTCSLLCYVYYMSVWLLFVDARFPLDSIETFSKAISLSFFSYGNPVVGNHKIYMPFLTQKKKCHFNSIHFSLSTIPPFSLYNIDFETFATFVASQIQGISDLNLYSLPSQSFFLLIFFLPFWCLFPFSSSQYLSLHVLHWFHWNIFAISIAVKRDNNTLYFLSPKKTFIDSELFK